MDAPRHDRPALLRAAFHAAVAAADPIRALGNAWPAPPSGGRVVVLALGKAAAPMAAAAEEHYARTGVPVTGVAAVPYGHGAATRTVRVHEAGHPVSDEASVRAGEALMEAAAGAGAADLALVLVSGGGSAVATVPDGVTLAELAELQRELLASGASIGEINVVRRRLDALKGGGLAAAAHPARVRALVVSDVVGDDPLAIASGPTVGDPGTAADALAVLDRYGLRAAAARAALEREAAGGRRPPPRPDDGRLKGVATTIVASAGRSLAAAARVFEDAGVAARIIDDAVTGDAGAAAREQADVVRRLLAGGASASDPLPVVLLSGGETTVAVRGDGRGGRNSTFALALALALPERAPVWALCADSDGLDGVGGHAGAFVDPDLFVRLPRDRARALADADDSYRAFAEAGALFETGPTRTNVNDLRFVWVDPPGPPREAGAPASPTANASDGAAGGASVDGSRGDTGPEAIRRAAQHLRDGGLVAFPTETVYGLGALARDPSAVARVFRAKGRPADHPLIVHLPHAGALGAWADPVPEAAVRLARAFWPGPLTLILPRARGVPDAVTGGQDTVGVRVPAHPVAAALLAEVDDGVAAPSANRFGRVSATRAEHVREEFPEPEVLVLDGGPAEVGVESTILDLTGPEPRLLRPGAIAARDLEEVLGTAVRPPDAAAPRVSGSLKGHYAPVTPTILAPAESIETGAAAGASSGLLLRLAAPPPEHAGPSVRLPGDPAGYAHGLYAALRELDAARPPRIVVEAPPEGAGWDAVRDRLRRAAGAHASAGPGAPNLADGAGDAPAGRGGHADEPPETPR